MKADLVPLVGNKYPNSSLCSDSHIRPERAWREMEKGLIEKDKPAPAVRNPMPLPYCSE
jgi:hypothetical protein